MTDEIKATTDDVFWVLRHTDGTYNAGTTPPGCVTSYSPAIWTLVWDGSDRDEWARQCRLCGIEAAE